MKRLLLMALMLIAPNFLRPGVVHGFALDLGAGLVPTAQIGTLVAQGTMYRPGSAPTLPATTDNAQRWLFYNSGSGFYWRNAITPATAGDAGPIGWVVAKSGAIIVTSSQTITIPDDNTPTASVVDLSTILSPGAGPTAACPAVTGFSVAESAAIAKDGHAVSRIAVSFTPPNPLLNWKGVQIFVTNYHGNPNAVIASDGQVSPLVFDLESSGDTVTFYAVAYNTTGALNDILTSPSFGGITLNGQTTGPSGVSNFTAQQVGAAIRFSWSENTETDIDHYELAKLVSAGTPANSDIFASIAAAGVNATRKASYDYTPGSSAGALFYYIRAVNASNVGSSWAGLSAITALAPDGTTDSGVPDAVYAHVSGSLANPVLFPDTANAAADGTLRLSALSAGQLVRATGAVYAHAVSIVAPLNSAGIKRLNLKITWTGQDSSSSPKTFVFSDDGVVQPNTKSFDMLIPNASITSVEMWFTNYFGDGVHFTESDSPLTQTGSKAQDTKAVSDSSYDPSAQHLGYSVFEGHAGTVARKNNGAGHAEEQNDVDYTVGARILIGGSAGSGSQFLKNGTAWSAVVAGDISSGTFATGQIPNLDASKITTGVFGAARGGLGTSNGAIPLRVFAQATVPTLSTNEIAIWYDTAGATHGGDIGVLFYDGTDFYWWAAPIAGGAVTLYKNPVP